MDSHPSHFKTDTQCRIMSLNHKQPIKKTKNLKQAEV